MDGHRFDEWTRRGFARSLGLALVGLAALPALGVAGTRSRRRRRRRDRCRRVTERCNRARDCCNTLACEAIAGVSGDRCCRRRGERCAGAGDCCGFDFCNTAGVCDVPQSDRALKANFASVDPVDMLTRVGRLSIVGWSENRKGDAVPRVGPRPEEFAAAFGLGAEAGRIHPIDGQGVALAAIQGAARALAETRAETDRLRARLEALERGTS